MLLVEILGAWFVLSVLFGLAIGAGLHRFGEQVQSTTLPWEPARRPSGRPVQPAA